MIIDPKHGRRSIRLKGYDYSLVGGYFITTCTMKRNHLFGDIMNGEMRLNEYGETVQDVWRGLPMHHPHVVLDAFVIMPNHVHGIIVLSNDIAGNVGAGLKPARTNDHANPIVRAGLKPAPTKPDPTNHGLPEIVRAFKTFSARRINERRQTAGVGVWQRNYYEHIIRNDESLNQIRQYIADNPLQWEFDRENRERKPGRKPVPQNEPWRI